jgi:hypothetical protein
MLFFDLLAPFFYRKKKVKRRQKPYDFQSHSDKVVLSGNCKFLVLEFDSLLALVHNIKGLSSVVRIVAFKATHVGSIPTAPDDCTFFFYQRLNVPFFA